MDEGFYAVDEVNEETYAIHTFVLLGCCLGYRGDLSMQTTLMRLLTPPTVSYHSFLRTVASSAMTTESHNVLEEVWRFESLRLQVLWFTLQSHITYKRRGAESGHGRLC